MEGFYEILERLGFTLYSYAAWFMPVTRFGAYGRVRPLLTVVRPHSRHDVAAQHGIDAFDELGKALFVKGKVTEEEALLIDTSPKATENFYFSIEVSPSSIESRDKLIALCEKQGANAGWDKVKTIHDAHDPKNPRFIVDFFAADFHGTIKNILKLFAGCDPEIKTLLSVY